jgi:hypothetical protein
MKLESFLNLCMYTAAVLLNGWLFWQVIEALTN